MFQGQGMNYPISITLNPDESEIKEDYPSFSQH